MDVDEDIKKMEAIIEQLECDGSSESHNSSSYLGNTSKRHKSNVCSSIESQEKVKNIQRSLKHNREYQSLLNSLESCLVYLLDECVKEQKIVNEAIGTIENGKASGCKLGGNSRTCSLRKACSSPYFKDYFGFSSKNNEDFSCRVKSGYLNPWDAIKTVPWTEDQKRILEQSIKNYKNPVSKSSLIFKDTNDNTSTSTTYVNDLIDPTEEKYDWIKISVVDLDNARSPLECHAIWFNYMHPKINKKRWSRVEIKVFKELVNHYKHQNWERIASDLKTNRSAYQCIGYYSIRHADFSRIKWSPEELLQLQELVKKLKVNYFTPWYKIAWLMDGRSTADIYRNWVSRYGALKKGPFSLQEDLILAAGLKEFGPDWSRIAQYLPNRQNIQVRSRLLILKNREHCCIPWSKSEDELLESLVEKYGFGNWAKISSHFITRDNVKVRTRYKSLTKVKERLDAGATIRSVGCRLSKNPNEERSLTALWKVGQKLVENKNIDNETDKLTSQANITYALSQIFKPRKKPGRKKGSINYPTYHKPYYNFFHVAHSQRGGRGKDICAEEKVPSLVHQIVLALQLLDANLFLPCVREMVYQDNSMLEMDKSVITYLIDRKEFVQDNCKFINFEDDLCSSNEFSKSSSSMEKSYLEVQETSDWYPLCSPCASTMIGLRTMLLNRANIRDQSKGMTVQRRKVSLSVPMQHSTKTSRYRSACKLWNKRIIILYQWAALFSKEYPENQFIFDLPSVEKNISSEVTCTVKKNGKKKINKSIDTSGNISDQTKDSALADIKPKRPYVKSGKFKMRNKVSGSARRNTRLTKTDL